MATLALRRHNRSRLLGPATLAVVGTLLLGGCSGSRGADAETTQTRLVSYPGITAADVSTGESKSGFSVSRSVHVTVTLEPGYVLGDEDALLKWLLRTGWSVNDGKVNSGVLVQLEDSTGVPVPWDWLGAVDSLGISTKQSAEDYAVTGSVGITADQLTATFGDWPGDIPEFTDDLIVTG